MSRASGIGSWPGTSVRATMRRVRDLLADPGGDAEPGIPYLPELPDRGPGADLIGRAAGLLVDLPVDLQPSGWRAVDRPGRDAARTASLWRQDLDELAEAYDGYVGDLKVQLAGPWTLAAELRLNRGERVVADPGAYRDLAASLAQGVAEHLRQVRRLVPGATLTLQLDEPSLPQVLTGGLRTSSGFGRLPAVAPDVVAPALRQVLAAAEGGPTVVHCCAPLAPLALLREAGAAAVSIDLSLLGASGWESLAATVDAGVRLWAGVATPADDGGDDESAQASGGPVAARALIADLTRRWHALGLGAPTLDQVVLTPACGLAGRRPQAAVRAQQAVVDGARALTMAARG